MSGDKRAYGSSPLAVQSKVWVVCWDCEFEYSGGHGYFLLVYCVVR